MKIKTTNVVIAISMMGFVLLCAPTSFAALISIDNPSFETLPSGGLPGVCAGPGCLFGFEGAIPGWGPAGGQYQPGPQASNFITFDSVPDGITVAYSNEGTISQTSSAKVELGLVYTLLVDQGLRKEQNNPGHVELRIGANAPIVASGSAPTPGGWSTMTASYTASAADVGKSITIALVTPGVQADWDNVRLDAARSVVPEPGMLALLTAGLIGLSWSARHATLSRAAV